MTGKTLNGMLWILMVLFFTALCIALDAVDKKDIYNEVAGFSFCLFFIIIMVAIDKPDTK